MTTIVDDVSAMTVATEANSFVLKQHIPNTPSSTPESTAANIAAFGSPSTLGLQSNAPWRVTPAGGAAMAAAGVEQVDRRLSSLEQQVSFSSFLLYLNFFMSSIF